MMASASSSNPYEHYDNTSIEQDLIDPDDGMPPSPVYFPILKTNVIVRSRYQRLRRPPTTNQRPSAPNRQHPTLLLLARHPPILPHLLHPRRRPARPNQHHRRKRVGDALARPVGGVGEDAAGAVAEVPPGRDAATRRRHRGGGEGRGRGQWGGWGEGPRGTVAGCGSGASGRDE